MPCRARAVGRHGTPGGLTVFPLPGTGQLGEAPFSPVSGQVFCTRRDTQK